VESKATRYAAQIYWLPTQKARAVVRLKTMSLACYDVSWQARPTAPPSAELRGNIMHENYRRGGKKNCIEEASNIEQREFHFAHVQTLLIYMMLLQSPVRVKYEKLCE
jgi:hypothetical protein